MRYVDLERLNEIVASIEGRPPRVLILTASDPGFSSGVDLKESREATTEFARTRSTFMQWILQRIRMLPCPVIAAIDGVAIGLGCELAISADLRLAAPSSRFRYPEPAIAVPSPTYYLAQIIGVARTQDMLLTARWIEAEEAASWGLVTTIVEKPLEAAKDLATQMLDLSPMALAKTKENLVIAMQSDMTTAVRHHIDYVAASAGSPDRAEALAAFAERRKPNFAPIESPGSRN
jgi:enoyl-CoA hydratase/carnithine racemase